MARFQIGAAVSSGELERVGRGLYVRAGAEVSEYHSMVLVARQVPHAAICLLSALRFHNLTTQNPHEVWIAIGPKDRRPAAGAVPVRVVRYGRANFTLGLEEHVVEGVRLQVYSVARTVVDLFRYRNKIGLEVALEALRDAWRERRFSPGEISRIAAACNMSKVMNPYLEAMTA